MHDQAVYKPSENRVLSGRHEFIYPSIYPVILLSTSKRVGFIFLMIMDPLPINATVTAR